MSGATILTHGGPLSGVNPAAPRLFKTYRDRASLQGVSSMSLPADAANFAAWLAKYNATTGIAQSPDWAVRDDGDGNAEWMFGLLGTDSRNPYIPLSGNGTFPLVTDNGHQSIKLANGQVQSYPFSDTFAVTTSLIMAVAVRDVNANTATSGYAICQKADALGTRMSLSNEPTGGSSRARAQLGGSIRSSIYGATKPALARWKTIVAVFKTGGSFKIIEDGAIAATGADTFTAGTYKLRMGCEATNGGASTRAAGDLWIGTIMAVADVAAASLDAAAIELNNLLRTKYGEP